MSEYNLRDLWIDIKPYKTHRMTSYNELGQLFLYLAIINNQYKQYNSVQFILELDVKDDKVIIPPIIGAFGKVKVELLPGERVKNATLFYSQKNIEHKLMHLDLSDRNDTELDTATFSFSKFPLVHPELKYGIFDFYFKIDIKNKKYFSRKIYINGFLIDTKFIDKITSERCK